MTCQPALFTTAGHTARRRTTQVTLVREIHVPGPSLRGNRGGIHLRKLHLYIDLRFDSLESRDGQQVSECNSFSSEVLRPTKLGQNSDKGVSGGSSISESVNRPCPRKTALRACRKSQNSS